MNVSAIFLFRPVRPVLGVVFMLLTLNLRAACPGCLDYAAGTIWGVTSTDLIAEASGLAMSAENPGVIWTHNDDGNDGHLYAFNTNGSYLGRYDFNVNLSDVEDMALGRGPMAGQTYLYVADIGGAGFGNELRGSVRILRMPEPTVSLGQSSAPARNLSGVERFTLSYPEQNADFDAEMMMLDPITGDLFVGTKQNSGARIYRVNLDGAANNAELDLEFVRTVPFSDASGGAISSDGRQIIIRREDAAQIWTRCDGESVGDALARAGTSIPVIGLPAEPNGEAIAFLPDGSGYLTVSDSEESPPFYFFQSLCAQTAITRQPESVNTQLDQDAVFSVEATGENLQYQWRFQETALASQTASTLTVGNVQSPDVGNYSVVVIGDAGAVTSNPAMLSVSILPPTILSQPQSEVVATGSTVQLSVTVQGTEPFLYRWAFGPKRLATTGPVLTLPNVQRKSAGKYRVTVSNSAGKTVSSYATLRVLIPPTITRQPLGKTLNPGSRFTFRVTAKGSLRLGYQWFFNDTPIAGASRRTLALRNLQSAASGAYSVVITNAVGSVTSAPAVLTIP